MVVGDRRGAVHIIGDAVLVAVLGDGSVFGVAVVVAVGIRGGCVARGGVGDPAGVGRGRAGLVLDRDDRIGAGGGRAEVGGDLGARVGALWPGGCGRGGG